MSEETPGIAKREILALESEGDRIEFECGDTETIVRVWEPGDRPEDPCVLRLSRDQADALADYLVGRGCGGVRF